MKKALMMVLAFLLVCTMVRAESAYYSFNAVTEKSAKAQFISSFKDLHEKTGARLVMKHFNKKALGIRCFVFVDVDQKRLTDGWKKSLRFFRVAFLGVKVNVENPKIKAIYGSGIDKATAIVKTFYDMDKLSNYIVRWQLFSDEFFLGQWAKENQIFKSEYFKGQLYGEAFSPKYTATLAVRGDGERVELFQETLKTRFYH